MHWIKSTFRVACFGSRCPWFGMLSKWQIQSKCIPCVLKSKIRTMNAVNFIAHWRTHLLVLQIQPRQNKFSGRERRKRKQQNHFNFIVVQAHVQFVKSRRSLLTIGKWRNSKLQISFLIITQQKNVSVRKNLHTNSKLTPKTKTTVRRPVSYFSEQSEPAAPLGI